MAAAVDNKKNARSARLIFRNHFCVHATTGEHGSFPAKSQPAAGANPALVEIDHNTEETVAVTRATGCWCGMTVYPISKLSPERVSAILREHGTERMIVDGSADWGVSDPLSLVKVAERMRADGHSEAAVHRIVFENPMNFYGQSPHWTPDFAIAPLDPREFQR